MHQKLTVRAQWDANEEVFYSDSNIQGLHIEAPTLEEFESVLMDVIPDLIKANYPSQEHQYPEPTRVWEWPSLRANYA